jgi:NTP pyrophosphatase (non-canonical NTP hydrolase)
MRKIYYHKDSKRGLKRTYERLVEEVNELGEALTKNKKTSAEEFADVLAWLASLANITKVNLEDAALKKYNYKCPKCGKLKCECTFEN